MMQCKDIPDEPILRLLAANRGRPMFLFNADIWERSIYPAFPDDAPYKLVLAKMDGLIRRGLVDGCSCGCRGDFEITAKGLEWLAKKEAA